MLLVGVINCLPSPPSTQSLSSIPCPAPAAAADYFDGGQHDCQEVLRVVMDLLHEDLVSCMGSEVSLVDLGGWRCLRLADGLELQ